MRLGDARGCPYLFRGTRRSYHAEVVARATASCYWLEVVAQAGYT